MQKGKIPLGKNIFLEVLLGVLVISVIFSVGFNTASQLTSVVHTGYYRIFKNGKVIGQIKNYEDIKTELIKKYGTKVPEEFYFGKGVEIEYTAYETPVVLTNVAEVLPQLNIEVKGLTIKTDKGKLFKAPSYRAWNDALRNTLQFVQENDKAGQKQTITGQVRVVENFNYVYERMPIEEVTNQKELEHSLLYRDIDAIKNDTVQSADTIATVARRNDISQEQLVYVNEIDKDTLLVPGTQLNVAKLDYAVEFSYPIIENITEEIKFEIAYQDDDEKYTDQEDIIQNGVNGQARAQYLSYMVNGQHVQGERLEYEILSEPVTQIISRGTKKRSSLSNGSDAPYANESGFIWPTQGLCISAGYMDPTYGGPHYGLDIAGNYREDVWSAAAGTVESAEFSGAFGNQVLIRHANGWKTRYAHLTSIGVHKGAELRQGKYVGAMGSTGLSTGVHLHFEVHVGGTRRNPLPYLPGKQVPRC